MRLERLKVSLEVQEHLPPYLQEEWQAVIRHRAETLVANYFFPRGLLSLFYAVVIAEVVTIVAVLPDIPYQLTVPFLLVTMAVIGFVSSRLVRRYRTFRSFESKSSDHEAFHESRK